MCKKSEKDKKKILPNMFVHRFIMNRGVPAMKRKMTTDMMQSGLAATHLRENLKLPSMDCHDHPTSSKRFPDGSQYRIEIPSTENVAAMKAVVEESKKYGVRVHRVSQGTGIYLMPEPELKDMLRIARDQRWELCLFVTNRNAWDVSATARTDAGRNSSGGHRGADQLLFALEDIYRACDLGLRSILVNDIGLMSVIDELKKQGKLPSNLQSKISVQMGPPNPATASLLEKLGASTLNPPTDLTVPQLSSIRSAVDVPLDVYVEAPDNFGGYVRHMEVPAMVRALAPMYVKLGLRNSPDIYPAGTHIEGTCVALSRERVRRARIALDILNRYYPEAIMSEEGPSDIGIPEI